MTSWLAGKKGHRAWDVCFTDHMLLAVGTPHLVGCGNASQFSMTNEVRSRESVLPRAAPSLLISVSREGHDAN